jgi:hypothetical protein
MKSRVRRYAGACILIALGIQGCSQETPRSHLTVRVTAQDTCESSGESFDCKLAGVRVVPLCPVEKCNVVVKPEAGSKTELSMSAFKSLLEQKKFSSVSYEERYAQ